MDKVEAIKRIKDHIRVHHIGEYPHIKIAEALNIAISALENDNNVGHKVEVLRCKDCKHFPKGVAVDFCRRTSIGMAVSSDDFCSYGERK